MTVLAALVAFLPATNYLTRLGIDFLVPIGPKQVMPFHPTPITVVVIDEVTHSTPPFSETPEVAWTPYIAQVVDRFGEAGVPVMGFDIVYPKTLGSPDLLPGFDRPFLQALAKWGRRGKIVLGEVRLSDQVIEPYEGQILAVGGRDNVRPLQFTPDGDGVVRRYPSQFDLENGEPIFSFANELARRAGHATAQGSFLIDFKSVPKWSVFRLSDIHSCLGDDEDFNFELFQNNIIIFGTALDVEDRHMAANRFDSGNQPVIQDQSCGKPVAVQIATTMGRQSVPGVVLHAQALQTILSDKAPRMLAPILNGPLMALLVGMLALVFLRLRPTMGALLLAGVVVLAWLGSAAALYGRVVLPYIPLGAAALVTYGVFYSYRVLFEEREKRWIRNAFQHYLSPALVDELSNNPSSLKLGGEKRRVAICFMDLEGFTALSEALADQPETLVDVMNGLLTEVSNIIEAHDGYVDKFVGDAVMAVWNAPVTIGEPELAAANAALACRKALQNRTPEPVLVKLGIKQLRMRFGLNAGEAIAGNVGSDQRFNYTVIGDAVNLAARLESANKTYGTSILAGEDLVGQLGDDIATRFIDTVTLFGKSNPVRVYEILGLRADLSENELANLETFEAGKQAYLARDFAAAHTQFKKLPKSDDTAQLFCERSRDFLENPPPDDWDGTATLSTK